MNGKLILFILVTWWTVITGYTQTNINYVPNSKLTVYALEPQEIITPKKNNLGRIFSNPHINQLITNPKNFLNNIGHKLLPWSHLFDGLGFQPRLQILSAKQLGRSGDSGFGIIIIWNHHYF